MKSDEGDVIWPRLTPEVQPRLRSYVTADAGYKSSFIGDPTLPEVKRLTLPVCSIGYCHLLLNP